MHPSQRILETANALDCDENEAAFDEKLNTIAKPLQRTTKPKQDAPIAEANQMTVFNKRSAMAAAIWLGPMMAFAQGTGAGTPLMPAGPFSSWPAETQAAAVKKVFAGCAMTGVMMLGNYGGPKDAGQAGAQAIGLACIVHQMPADWPDRSDILQKEAAAYLSAKALDPKFFDPEKVFPPSNP